MFSSATMKSFVDWKIYIPQSSHQFQPLANNFSFFERRFSTHAWSHMTSTYDVIDVISGKKTLPDGVHFTITNPKYTIRNFSELGQIYAALGSKQPNRHPYRLLRDLVIFTPERTAFQWTSIAVSTQLKVENDKHYLDICSKLDKKIQPMIAAHAASFDTLIREKQASVYDKIRQCKSKGLLDDKIVDQYFHIGFAIKKKLGDQTPQSYIDTVASKIICDDHTREALRAKIQTMVLDVILDEIRLQQFSALDAISEKDRQQFMLLLPQFAADKRLTQFSAGGPASGKTLVMIKQFAAYLKSEYGLEFSQVALLSTDRFRLRLTNDASLGQDAVQRSTLSQDEARMMTEQGIAFIGKEVEQFGCAPNVLVESVSPLNEELNVGLLKKGKIQVAIASYPPAEAVNGNFKRYTAMESEEKRLAPVSSVLGGQRRVSQETPKILNRYAGTDIVITLHDTYKMMHTQEENALIAVLHCRKNEIFVFDIPGLLDFVKKSHINPTASSPETIYPNAEQVSYAALVELMLKEYGDKKIIFINPAIKSIDYNDIEKHMYASYSAKDGLVVTQPEIFAKLEQTDKMIANMFDVLATKQQPVPRYARK